MQKMRASTMDEESLDIFPKKGELTALANRYVQNY